MSKDKLARKDSKDYVVSKGKNHIATQRNTEEGVAQSITGTNSRGDVVSVEVKNGQANVWVNGKSKGSVSLDEVDRILKE